MFPEVRRFPAPAEYRLRGLRYYGAARATPPVFLPAPGPEAHKKAGSEEPANLA
jgi:hypothetical protein